jgi:hypothetical protein
MCTGIAHWYRPTGALSLDQLVHRYINLALQLLRAEREGTALHADTLNMATTSRG